MPMQKRFPRNEASTRRKRPVYDIPAVPEPSGTRCVVLHVPDSLDHLAVLLGALRELTKWRNWALDADHNAIKCAKLWSNLLEEYPVQWGDCPMPALQFRQNGNCLLELSEDGGTTWNAIYDGYACGRDAARDEIYDQQQNDNLQGGGQPGSKGGGIPGQCFSYHTKLSANTQWKLPVTIEDGDIITISNVKGGWTDNAPNVGYWYCPDGSQYVLGACTGSGSTSSLDPAPTINHMRLIIQVGAVYADAYNTTYTVPGGMGQVDAFLQANDVQIYDNGGDIELDIEICKGGWCYEFGGSNGWSGWSIPGSLGAINGNVIDYTSSGPYMGAQAQYTGITANVRKIQYTTEAAGNDNHYLATYSECGTASSPSMFCHENAFVGTRTSTWEGNQDITDLWIDGFTAASYLDTQYEGHIVSLKIWGTGTCPFGLSNC